VIPLIGGVLSDIIGDRSLLLFGTIMILLGWVVSCLGMIYVSFAGFLIGQII